jgi:hypothetical protein
MRFAAIEPRAERQIAAFHIDTEHKEKQQHAQSKQVNEQCLLWTEAL